MAQTASISRQAERVDGKKILGATLLGAALAAVVNVFLWAVMQFVLQLNLQVQLGGPTSPLEPLSVVPVIVATIIPGLIAGVFLWLVGRFTPRPYTIFLVIAIVALLISFLAAFLLPVGLVQRIGMNTMHVGAAVPIIWALMTRTRAV